MNEGGRWVTINGRKVFIKDKATNEYMNDMIRGKQKYTEKDIKTLYGYNRDEFVTGYELNGIYLLKNDNPYATTKEDYKTGQSYRWLINETGNNIPTTHYNGVRFVDTNADDKVTYYHTFKEGKEALVRIANKKKK